jgi:Ca2+-binding RTX toxin-like protein
VGDQINGREGDDVILALGGRDEVFGREGDDTILGGNSSDVLWGGTENDVVVGRLGSDLSGVTDPLLAPGITAPAPGSDTHGNDTLLGGSGDDVTMMGKVDVELVAYHYTADGGAVPAVTVTPDADGNAIVSVDGAAVAVVNGAGTTMTVDDVILVERPALAMAS